MPAKRRAVHEHDEEEEMMHDGDMSTSYQKYFNPNYSAEFMNKLPERIRERAQVLMYYHEEYEKLNKNFEEKEMELRRKYDELYVPLYERRKEIVTGASEPTEEEVKKGFPSEHEGKVDIVTTEKDTEKGLPGFWLRVLEHHLLSASLIEEHDRDVLKHLTDVRSGVVEGGYGSFAVVFVFEPNEFIEEESLMLGLVQKEGGVSIVRSPLTWKEGKNVTVEKVRKKVGGKRGKLAKTTTVTVPRPSFFNIFLEKKSGNDDNDDDEEDEEDEADDEQIEQLLQLLHTSIIPCAANCYTGEAPDGGSDIDMDEEDDEEDDDDEDDDDRRKPAHRGRGAHVGRGGAANSRGQQQECKQQ
ncbi:Nucleosome assembly protein (NAP) [Trypanosoma melophagium]|uniref:Nucleosome assembly protein (NAP) n=1 Tax=Trypanosoma melophagium TaxID=715481 RepID=UPI00351A27F1|nr:Nucleosome assembly protein (NAP) [Trypanosoma melophagium]